MIRLLPTSTLFPYTTLFRSELLEALELLGDQAPYVLYVGRGECEKDLYRLVEKSSARSRVRFAGYLKRDRLYEARSEEHTSELQSRRDLVCRLLLEKKKDNI